MGGDPIPGHHELLREWHECEHSIQRGFSMGCRRTTNLQGKRKGKCLHPCPF